MIKALKKNQHEVQFLEAKLQEQLSCNKKDTKCGLIFKQRNIIQTL